MKHLIGAVFVILVIAGSNYALHSGVNPLLTAMLCYLLGRLAYSIEAEFAK